MVRKILVWGVRKTHFVVREKIISGLGKNHFGVRRGVGSFFVHFQQTTFQPGCRDLAAWDPRPSGFWRQHAAVGKKGAAQGADVVVEVIRSSSQHPVLLLVHILVVFAVFLQTVWAGSTMVLLLSCQATCLPNLILLSQRFDAEAVLHNPSVGSEEYESSRRPTKSCPRSFRLKHHSHSDFKATRLLSLGSRFCLTAPPSHQKLDLVQPSNSSPDSSVRECAAYDVSLYEFLGSRVMAWCGLMALRYLSI